MFKVWKLISLKQRIERGIQRDPNFFQRDRKRQMFPDARIDWR